MFTVGPHFFHLEVSFSVKYYLILTVHHHRHDVLYFAPCAARRTMLTFFLVVFLQENVSSSTNPPIFHNESLSGRSTVPAHHETSGQPLDAYPALQCFFVICLALQSVFGTIGNLLVIINPHGNRAAPRTLFSQTDKYHEYQNAIFFSITRLHSSLNVISCFDQKGMEVLHLLL